MNLVQTQLNFHNVQKLKEISVPVNIFWFRRDLRLEDNCGLYHALKEYLAVLPIFIFDTNILAELKDRKDRRIEFIHQALGAINLVLKNVNSGLVIFYGNPEEIWQELIKLIRIHTVYTNHDYEPYARHRDNSVQRLLEDKGIEFKSFKDQVIFERDQILTAGHQPYVVYTAYKNRWLQSLKMEQLNSLPSEKHLDHFLKINQLPFPSLEQIGFEAANLPFPALEADERLISDYDQTRDYPALNGTTRLGIHLRFGTISIRPLVKKGLKLNETWLSELIWREFFMMILWFFPQVVNQPFRKKYEKIKWRNDPQEFEKWCQGMTGFPMVDAGMRELNSSGYMHNRVRMICASFLTKHLLIDWRWGERYFAEKLLDYELASNNGNWQWAAGCGCDAAPYFRIFNPQAQLAKFDSQMEYIRRWLPEYGSADYPAPMLEHALARERALSIFKTALNQ